MGDGAADYDLLNGGLPPAMCPAELCSCSHTYPSEGPSADRYVLIESARKLLHSTRPVFSLPFIPQLLSGFTVVSSVKWADGELMLLFAATVQEGGLGIIID